MSEVLLTKRLHISGLTPSIKPTDLERRLSVFGKVKAMDGFGARDGLGDPRKFGFVTMEIGAKELAKCLNVLSGSTWKGAKLRIGEAKPDFRERIAQLNAAPAKPIRPKRTPRNLGRPSSTLPLTPPLSTSTASTTPGWIVAPSGRVVRPMRMRPDHPLDPTRTELAASKVKGKVKRRVKPPAVRARRRLIDPTKWDSVYLKGVYLDAVEVPMPKATEVSKAVEEEEDIESESNEEKEEEEVREDEEIEVSGADEPDGSSPQPAQSRPPPTTDAQQSPAAVVPTPARVYEATGTIDIREEANAALAMLGNMFGDQEDWGGSESVDDIEGLDRVAVANMTPAQVDEQDEIEIVSRNPVANEETNPTKKEKKKSKGKEKAVDDVVPRETEQSGDRDVEMEEPGSSITKQAPSSQVAPSVPARTSLKDLFAPREEESFSLVNHLDLDLELEDDILGLNAPFGPSQVDDYASQPIAPQSIPFTIMTSNKKGSDRVTLDPSYPLLFPLPESLPFPYPSSSSNTPSKPSHSQNIPNCILFPPRTTPPPHLSHLNFLPPAHTFCRSPNETSETIRERWEREKVALTREWKKASREARGSRRARADRSLPDIPV